MGVHTDSPGDYFQGPFAGKSSATDQPEWKQRAAFKRAAQLRSIPEEWRLPYIREPPQNTLHYLRTSGLLTSDELEITEILDAAVLLEKLASRQLTAVSVTRSFSKRAAIAHQLIGCCTEMFFDEALVRAAALDEYLERTGNTVGPLHGLPVSLKDLIDVEGHDTTWGWIGLIDKPAAKNSVLVEALMSQGAIPYVKTNLSQSIMMSDSYNHVFKQSLHPWNRRLISGGSSGGEGALVGCLGSIVGFGTDTGGSIRIPSNMQGLYGLCPTVGRVPFVDSGRRIYISPPVAGPMANSLSSIEAMMSGLLKAEPWNADPIMVPIPWRTEAAKKPSRRLRIGYYIDDGRVKPQPPLQYAVLSVIEKLKAAGHDVFIWDASSHGDLYERWRKAIMSDGGRVARHHCKLSGEPLIPGMIVGTDEDKLNIEELEELAEARVMDQQKYLNRWKNAKLDALITPVQTFVNFPPKVWVHSSQYVGYSAIWNWLGFGALTMPVTTVDKENADSDPEWNAHVPRNISDEFNHENYNPEQVMGMPVGIQVVGGRYGEENAVAVAKAVQEVLGSDEA